MKVWDVRRASGSLLTLDQHNGDKSKASSEAGSITSPLFSLFCLFHSSWVGRALGRFYLDNRIIQAPGQKLLFHRVKRCLYADVLHHPVFFFPSLNHINLPNIKQSYKMAYTVVVHRHSVYVQQEAHISPKHVLNLTDASNDNNNSCVFFSGEEVNILHIQYMFFLARDPVCVRVFRGNWFSIKPVHLCNSRRQGG